MIARNLVWSPLDTAESINSQYASEQEGNEGILEIFNLKDGMRVLDVGCGTGYWTIDVAKRVAPGGWAVGLDRSRNLMRHGEERAKSEGVSNIEFVRGDGRTLKFQDHTFDLVFSKYMLQNYTDDLAPFLREMKRVTKLGGKVVAIDRESLRAQWPPPPEAYRKLLSAEQEYKRIIGWGDRETGRKLYSFFVRAGFEKVKVMPDLEQGRGRRWTEDSISPFRKRWMTYGKELVDEQGLLSWEELKVGIEAGVKYEQQEDMFWMEVTRCLAVGTA